MRTLAVLPLLFLPVIAWGDCTEHLQTWAQDLHPTLTFDSNHAVCKINPGNATQVLAALPFASDLDENGDGEYGLDVLVADGETGKIIAHFYQEAAISSDAIRFSSLQLDTARYQLTPKLRAFGVRITHEGSSRPNPYGREILNLYVQDGSQLRRVMSNLVVDKSYGEWDTRCAGEFNDTQRTLAVGNPGKQGFASLRVTEKSIDRKSISKPDDDCEEVEGTPKTVTFTLEYDGVQYRVPEGLAGW